MSLLEENQSTDLEKMVGLSRRGFISAGALCGAAMFLGGNLLSRSALATGISAGNSRLLGFESIPAATTDVISLPKGYKSSVLISWGQPLYKNGPAFDPSGNGTAAAQEVQFGDNNDGMSLFEFPDDRNRALMAINNEYTNYRYLYPHGGMPQSAEDVRKALACEGVSVIEVQRRNGQWQFVQGSRYNRRIHGNSPLRISGPAAGHELMKTAADKHGKKVLGTFQNCANGKTPWGTYLTCEENWPGIFVNKGTRPEDQRRIGVGTSSGQYKWESAAGDSSEVNDEFARFDVTVKGASATDDYRNEASTYGYIVEIDPYNSSTLATKRTALGRFRHEGCCPGLPVVGKPLVWYMGDDSNNEYLYKFVSAAVWDAADANPADRLATGAKYMDQGKLYVARFNADGSGVWLLLDVATPTAAGTTLGALYGDLPGIILNTRGAGDAVGATPMDRPEWTAVNPLNGDVYLTLTNNSARTPEKVDAANPRGPNRHGHIIRWHDSDDQLSFTWDIFVFGANAAGTADINRSGLTELNQFASPDGMSFDSRGVLWFETDNGESTLTDYTNDQLLAVIPTDLVDGTGKQVPINAQNQVDLRRFFVGPNGCEVTGIAFSPDNKSMFVNIQHPENWPYTDKATDATPAGATVRPRASTVVIQRDDGGEIGTV